MYMLVLQTFLLMLAAFVLGAALACLTKRSLHRFAADDVPAEQLHVDVPPAVHRSAAVAAAKPVSPPVAVTPSDTQRFERALVGDVAAGTVATEAARSSGPMIEVQPLPVPPPPPPAPETPMQYVETYEDTLPPFPVQEPEPEPQPEADIPLVSREQDAAAQSGSSSYAAEALAVAGGALAAGETYNAIAVASHDGSMLPPPGVVEASLPPPTMPGPSPEPLPVPLATIPEPVRPEEAPEPPHRSYVEDAISAGAVYVPQPEPAEPDFELSPSDPNEFSIPPEGETYASVALGGVAPSAAAAPAPAEAAAAPVEVEPAFETKPTHVSTALAAAAGIAAERATAGHDAGGPDDLTRIQGIDDVIASRLEYVGVSKFSQIASWSADDVRRMSQTLGFFGRIQDEYWIDQARLLASGAAPASVPSYGTGSDEAPPPAAEAAPHANAAGAADIATAAAAAAAAAMVASYSRQGPQPTRPAKLADAIRDHSGAQDEQTDSDAGNETDEAPGSAESTSRSGVTGLRSIRSEALLGDDAEFVRGDLEDLKRIRGIGVLIEKKLNSLGITSYEQVANWSATDVERISEILDFKGRIERENWIEQARILASGGQTEFSRRVDRGEA